MLTNLGVFLRKLRLDHNEILKDMALRLGVSVSFLSAVENGKKKMPQKWVGIIQTSYNLSVTQLEDFEKAIANTENIVEINLKNLNSIQKEFAVSLARQLDFIDETNIKKMMKLFKEDKK